jgi:hypothetical protein
VICRMSNVLSYKTIYCHSECDDPQYFKSWGGRYCCVLPLVQTCSHVLPTFLVVKNIWFRPLMK